MVLLSGCEMQTDAYPSVCGALDACGASSLCQRSFTNEHADPRFQTSTITGLRSQHVYAHPSAYGVQDLCVHQTETGRAVTDAVVQEVCKLRPDMIGLSLRDCVEVGPCRRYLARNLRTIQVDGGGGEGAKA